MIIWSTVDIDHGFIIVTTMGMLYIHTNIKNKQINYYYYY